MLSTQTTKFLQICSHHATVLRDLVMSTQVTRPDTPFPHHVTKSRDLALTTQVTRPHSTFIPSYHGTALRHLVLTNVQMVGYCLFISCYSVT